ncbi:MAG: major capsid protein, partial [Candidatus Methanomethylicaceae archaeon]
LRTAARLQEWLERNAVAGSRYNESIMAHFGRRTSDGRLQRAEYLGGARQAIQISEVMTTAYSQDAESNIVPPANMTGKGLSYGNQNRFRRNFEEHGFVLGIMSVMPTSAYMQGIPRMFINRNSFLDYPWPSFAHLGEEPVYDYEVYADPTTVPNVNEEPSVFGYQSRYSDWKWLPSTAHGDFRTTLDFWHLDRKFESKPVLGQQFVQFEDELQDRIFAVAETDTLWCYVRNEVSVIRSLPYFGTPSL